MTTTNIIAGLDQLLKPLGFSRKKLTWNRSVSGFVDVLDVQISKAGDTVTLNTGVLERSIYAECWGREATEFVEEPSCTVRARIGELIDREGKDKWWKIDDAEAVEDIAVHVTDRVLPFVEEMHSLEAMLKWLSEANVAKQKRPPEVIYLAILKHRLGHQIEACATLKEYQQRSISAGWKAKAGKIAERLGCS